MRKPSLTTLFAVAALSGCASTPRAYNPEYKVYKEDCIIAETQHDGNDTLVRITDFKNKLVTEYLEQPAPCWFDEKRQCNVVRGGTFPFAEMNKDGRAIAAANAKRLPKSCTKN